MFEDLFIWVQGVRPEDLPAAPFLLYPHVTVINTAEWLKELKRDALGNMNSPRAKYGALQKDLRRIRSLCNMN